MLRSRVSAKSYLPPMIQAAPDGFKVLENGEGAETPAIGWHAIRTLSAFKRDDFTIDTLCLQVELESGKRFLLTEDMAGFSVFIDQMIRSLPGIPADWRRNVLVPPFAENHTVLFHKAYPTRRE